MASRWPTGRASTRGFLVFGASFVGQGLGADQMYFLRASLTEAVHGEEADPGRG